MKRSKSTSYAIRPGISGPWQISGEPSLYPDEKLEKDKHYIEQMSFRLDFLTFLGTLKVIFLKNEKKYMQFLVVANDFPDVLAKRMEVRPQHLKNVEVLFQKKQLLYGIGIIDDAGNLRGSVMLFEVESRAALDTILKDEVYITSKIWNTVTIYPARVGPFWQP